MLFAHRLIELVRVLQILEELAGFGIIGIDVVGKNAVQQISRFGKSSAVPQFTGVHHGNFGILGDHAVPVGVSHGTKGQQVEGFAVFGNGPFIVLFRHQAVAFGFGCQRIGNPLLARDDLLFHNRGSVTTTITSPENRDGKCGGARDAYDQGLTLQR